jgi:hypothetical protein
MELSMSENEDTTHEKEKESFEGLKENSNEDFSQRIKNLMKNN